MYAARYGESADSSKTLTTESFTPGNSLITFSISPGSIVTERQSKLWLNSKFKEEILKKQSLKKQLLPDDISKMVLFLASEVSSGCTKQNFTVDGGLT